MVKVKKEKYNKWLNTKHIEDKIEFKKIQAEIRKKVATEKNKSWEKTCNTIQTYIGGRKSSEAWRILKNLRKNGCENHGIDFISMDKWETYFKELSTEKRNDFLETIVEESNENGQTNYIQLDLIDIEIIVK